MKMVLLNMVNEISRFILLLNVKSVESIKEYSRHRGTCTLLLTQKYYTIKYPGKLVTLSNYLQFTVILFYFIILLCNYNILF